MAYTIRYYGITLPNTGGNTITVADGTLNISTSLALPGRNYAGYGSAVDQDLVSLLENFASANATNGPSNPIVGQMWFSTANANVGSLQSVKVNYGGNTWVTLASSDANSVVNFGKVFTPNLNAGNSNTSVGMLYGNWTVAQGSAFNLATGGTANFIGSDVLVNVLKTGNSVANTGDIIGTWTLDSGSSITLGAAAYIDTRQGNLLASNLSAGGPTNNANITGNWTVTQGSTISLFSSKFYLHPLLANGSPVPGSNSVVDLRTTGAGDFFYANSINAGSATSNANLTGNWFLTDSSNLYLGNGTVLDMATYPSTFYSKTLFSANPANVSTKGNISGNWLLTTGSTFDARAGNLYSNTLNTGAAGTPGVMTGNWSYSSGSVLDLASNSAVLYANRINSGSSSTQGQITGNWILTSGSQLNATYADLGERFAADDVYEAGTVVELGGDAEVTAVRDDLSDNVFGVVSNTAGYIMNGMAGTPETHPVIAMTGRVLVKVKGTVKKGERLVSAGAGYARAAKEGEVLPKRIVGRALESKTTQGNGTVLAAVSVNI